MNGATIVPEMTELRPRPSAFGSAAKIRPRTRFTASRISHVRTSVQNTCQPRPLTKIGRASCREGALVPAVAVAVVEILATCRQRHDPLRSSVAWCGVDGLA